MVTKINIKTPAGKSLEGFPMTYEIPVVQATLDGVLNYTLMTPFMKNPVVNKGDIITIEVL